VGAHRFVAGLVLMGEPAAYEQRAAEGQRVGRHHPLPVTVRKTRRPLGRRQRHVHDGGIEDHHQRATATTDRITRRRSERAAGVPGCAIVISR